MKVSQDIWIISGFALLHAAVALACRVAGMSDDVMLTLLTMLMVIVIFLRRQVSVAFMAIAVAAVNIIGYLLGMWTAALLSRVLGSPLAIYPLSTLVCTLVIGVGTLWAAVRYSRRHPRRSTTAGSLRWLLIAFVAIIAVRLAILLGSDSSMGSPPQLINILLNYIMTLAVVIIVTESALRFQGRAQVASEEANLARWRYLRLKQQVNPHFLFNSLNVLDCMIQEQSREDASAYTHKLAEIYRYMIHNEDKVTVSLRDEMEFVGQYVDLLRVRFPEGLQVEVDIPAAAMLKRVVPCSVQLLIENATKHNSVMPGDPLRITIASDGETLTVSNNVRPKMSAGRADGTGLGLKYIRQQYRDISGEGVVVEDGPDMFVVSLPLL